MATVTVETHPMSALFAEPGMKRWRVMVNGQQQSVHESPEDAEAAAQDCRNRFSSGWGPSRGGESRGGTSKGDWKR